MAKVAIQGGGPNYLGKQPEVKVPRYWKSSPDHPDTELAYITKPEKEVLIALNMHGGLEDGKPNKGPKGIMSLQGDMGSVKSDGKGGHVGTGDDVELPPAVAAAVAAGKPTSVNTKEDEKKAKKEAYDFRKSKYAQGYEPVNIFEKANFYNSEFQKKQNIKLAQKRALQKYKDLEKYANLYDDIGYSNEEIQDIISNPNNPDYNPSFGYDFSDLAPGKKTLGSNIGTNLEKYRANLYDINPSTKYSVTQAIFDSFRPDTQVTALNTLNKARDYTNLVNNSSTMTNQEIKTALTELQNRGKTPDQINPPRDDNRGLPYLIPTNYTTGVTLPINDVAEEKTFDYRFGTGQNVGRDVTLGYAANGGRITRAGGGIMNAVPRQGYFLGKVVDTVKDVVGGVADAAGKVLKSDFGKAALMAGAFYYGGGGGNPFTAAGRAKFSPGAFFSKSNPLLFSNEKFNPLKMAGLLTLGGAAMGPAKQDSLEDFGNRGGRLKDSLGNEVLPAGIRAEIDKAYESGDPEQIKRIEDYYAFLPPRNIYLPYPNYAVGGRVAAQEGGLMDLGGMEKDYRNEGGFVPIGREEKADDVPARLSVNEFVMTADAVRNAGGGDIDKGAEVMENMMKNLENGGRISEESQGNTGAQQMFSVSERIGEVI